MDSRHSGLGVVIPDSYGSLVVGNCVNGSASSVLEAKAKTAILAMQTAISWNLDNVLFESDSASLVQYINRDKKKVSWSIFRLPCQIWNLRHHFNFFKWCWVSCQVNLEADWVTSHCRKGMCPDAWVSRPPSALVHILFIDGLPSPH